VPVAAEEVAAAVSVIVVAPGAVIVIVVITLVAVIAVITMVAVIAMVRRGWGRGLIRVRVLRLPRRRGKLGKAEGADHRRREAGGSRRGTERTVTATMMTASVVRSWRLAGNQSA
jgi:hypothetical protein